MANLQFYYGVMGSSKSAALLINAYNYNQNKIHTEIIKPAYDTRFGATKVTSRIGLSADAVALKSLNEYAINPNTDVLFVDEVQFFTPDDINKLVHIADTQGKIVMCYGLLVDSNEHMFPASKRLIEVGAKLHRLKSTCQMNGCKCLATHHLRFDAHGKVIREGEQFALGDDNYKSVCRNHFYELYYNRGAH